VAANASLVLTTLDFDTLKQSFVNFMRSQSEFKDYDYAASNMNVLIDLLTYNSHLNAFYTNMELAESFLDSAQLKSSVISHAKELNYVPRSSRSAEANIQIQFIGPQSTYLLQKGQTFSSTIKSNTYSFSIGDNILLTSTNNYFTANISIFEGVYVYDTYTLNSSDPTQRLVISNINVDISSLTVVVYENNNIVGTPYIKATTLLGLQAINKVFFVQEAENEQYEILFGDGVIGYRPKDGSTISINYRITNGSLGNGAKVFTMNFNPGPTSDASGTNVATIAVSAGGADPEDIESIRYYAPRAFQIQERATSANDYAIMLRTQFPEISAISTYGGEELNPPQYGHVAIAIKITDVDGLPDSKVQAYATFLSDKTSLTTRPIFVVPQFSYIAIRTTVNYNINLTALTPDNIRTLVIISIQNFAASNLGNFANRFRYSRFVSMIDSTDISIVGNETETLLYRKFSPPLAITSNINIDFAMALQEGVVQPGNIAGSDFHSVYSSNFLLNGAQTRFEDDGNGNIFIVTTFHGVEQFVNQVGTVNYDTGLVSLTSFRADSYDGPFIKVYARTREKDILENQATILNIEGGEIQVTVNTVRE
jgi:hypothetical protein